MAVQLGAARTMGEKGMASLSTLTGSVLTVPVVRSNANALVGRQGRTIRAAG